jgi:hypothetical protein
MVVFTHTHVSNQRLLIYQSQSQSYITTDSQSVCLGVEPNLGLLTRDFFLK